MKCIFRKGLTMFFLFIAFSLLTKDSKAQDEIFPLEASRKLFLVQQLTLERWWQIEYPHIRNRNFLTEVFFPDYRKFVKSNISSSKFERRSIINEEKLIFKKNSLFKQLIFGYENGLLKSECAIMLKGRKRDTIMNRLYVYDNDLKTISCNDLLAGNSWIYLFNDMGNIKSIKTGTQKVSYNYDLSGRLTLVHFSNGTDTMIFNFSYCREDKLKLKKDFWRFFLYDSLERDSSILLKPDSIWRVNIKCEYNFKDLSLKTSNVFDIIFLYSEKNFLSNISEGFFEKRRHFSRQFWSFESEELIKYISVSYAIMNTLRTYSPDDSTYWIAHPDRDPVLEKLWLIAEQQKTEIGVISNTDGEYRIKIKSN